MDVNEEFFVKIQKKKNIFCQVAEGVRWGWGWWGGGQDGCERNVGGMG